MKGKDFYRRELEMLKDELKLVDDELKGLPGGSLQRCKGIGGKWNYTLFAICDGKRVRKGISKNRNSLRHFAEKNF